MNDKSKLELIGEIAEANNKNLELIQEINQLQSNWNSLREWLEETMNKENIYPFMILDKMNELEGKNNNE